MSLSKAQQTNVSNDLKTQKDVLMYRAHIGLGDFDIVINEIKDNKETHVSLRAVRLLALYLKSLKNDDERGKKRAIQEMEELLKDPMQAQDTNALVAAATMYSHEGNDSEVLRLVHNPNSLELASIQIKTLLRMNRVDLAEKALKTMMEMNDDATITQLTNAYLLLIKGGQERIEEAELIFQQLQKKFGNSNTILNGLALCMFQSGAFENAERTLLSSLGLSPNDPETLINLIACAQHLKKPADMINKYMNQLQSVAPFHPWVKTYNQLSTDFDNLATTFSK